MIQTNKNKKVNDVCIIIFFLCLALTIVFCLMYKYHVEGETNMPFNITKLIVISSAKTKELEKNEEGYQANIMQNNDIYIAIEKNENYKKEDAIKNITINNFNLLEKGNIGTLKIYRPSTSERIYEYIDNYKTEDKLEFIGDLNTNLKMDNMTISNQGRTFRI